MLAKSVLNYRISKCVVLKVWPPSLDKFQPTLKVIPAFYRRRDCLNSQIAASTAANRALLEDLLPQISANSGREISQIADRDNR